MAIRFMVIFEVEENAPEEHVQEAFDKADNLLSEIPGVRKLVAGPNINPNSTKRLRGFNVDFDSMEAMRTYVAHENHAAALTAIRPYNKAATNCLIEI